MGGLFQLKFDFAVSAFLRKRLTGIWERRGHPPAAIKEARRGNCKKIPIIPAANQAIKYG